MAICLFKRLSFNHCHQFGSNTLTILLNPTSNLFILRPAAMQKSTIYTIEHNKPTKNGKLLTVTQ